MWLNMYVNYSRPRGQGFPLTAGRGRSSTDSKGCSHPFNISRDASVLPVRAVDGAEAHLTDPRFNRGVSVTLTPSMNIA